MQVNADYQLEIDLRSYMNPNGRTSDGDCCEPEAMNPRDNLCLPQETCDTRFSFRLQNFDRLRNIASTIVLGPFENSDDITFPSCGEIINGNTNPLTFTFPTTDFSIHVSKILYDLTV